MAGRRGLEFWDLQLAQAAFVSVGVVGLTITRVATYQRASERAKWQPRIEEIAETVSGLLTQCAEALPAVQIPSRASFLPVIRESVGGIVRSGRYYALDRREERELLEVARATLGQLERFPPTLREPAVEDAVAEFVRSLAILERISKAMESHLVVLASSVTGHWSDLSADVTDEFDSTVADFDAIYSESLDMGYPQAAGIAEAVARLDPEAPLPRVSAELRSARIHARTATGGLVREWLALDRALRSTDWAVGDDPESDVELGGIERLVPPPGAWRWLGRLGTVEAVHLYQRMIAYSERLPVTELADDSPGSQTFLSVGTLDGLSAALGRAEKVTLGSGTIWVLYLDAEATGVVGGAGPVDHQDLRRGVEELDYTDAESLRLAGGIRAMRLVRRAGRDP